MTTTLHETSTTDGDGASRSTRRVARLAGVSYLVMFLLAIFSNFAVIESLFEPRNAEATVQNITGSLGTLRLGIAGFIVIAVLDVVIAWALHVLFRGVDHDLSLAAAWFRVAYSAVLAVAVASLFRVLQIIDGGLDIAAGDTATQTMIALADFQTTWLTGLALFGVHLALLGRLLLRSGSGWKVLGYVLVVAGVAYVVDTIARFVLADYEAVAAILLVAVALPSMIGEGWLGFRLLLSRKSGW